MNLSRRRCLHLAAGAAALLISRTTTWAQGYPTRPIRLVIPFPPGGAFDAVGRPWADRVRSLLGTVVIENMGGGGSSLGAAAVARARPDGYTILLGGTQTHVNEALLKARPLYDPVKDLDPIAGGAASDPEGAHHVCEGQPRQAVLRALRYRLDPASDRRAVQIPRRNT